MTPPPPVYADSECGTVAARAHVRRRGESRISPIADGPPPTTSSAQSSRRRPTSSSPMRTVISSPCHDSRPDRHGAESQLLRPHHPLSGAAPYTHRRRERSRTDRRLDNNPAIRPALHLLTAASTHLRRHSRTLAQPNVVPCCCRARVGNVRFAYDYGQLYIYDATTGVSADGNPYLDALDAATESGLSIGAASGVVDVLMPRQENFSAEIELMITRSPRPLEESADHIIEFDLESSGQTAGRVGGLRRARRRDPARALSREAQRLWFRRCCAVVVRRSGLPDRQVSAGTLARPTLKSPQPRCDVGLVTTSGANRPWRHSGTLAHATAVRLDGPNRE